MIRLRQPFHILFQQAVIRISEGFYGFLAQPGLFQLRLTGCNEHVDTTELIRKLDEARAPQLGSAQCN